MVKIAIFGGSAVEGALDTEEGGWVERLRKELLSSGWRHRVYNLGVSGATSTDILKRFLVEAKARRPEVIIFSTGVNDSSYTIKTIKESKVRLSNFINNIEKLVELSKAFTDNIAFGGLPEVDERKTMPMAKGVYISNTRIKQYDRILRDLTKTLGVDYIDSPKFSPRDLADGLHPNAQGHKKIFRTVRDYLERKKLLDC